MLLLLLLLRLCRLCVFQQQLVAGAWHPGQLSPSVPVRAVPTVHCCCLEVLPPSQRCQLPSQRAANVAAVSRVVFLPDFRGKDTGNCPRPLLAAAEKHFAGAAAALLRLCAQTFQPRQPAPGASGSRLLKKQVWIVAGCCVVWGPRGWQRPRVLR